MWESPAGNRRSGRKGFGGAGAEGTGHQGKTEYDGCCAMSAELEFSIVRSAARDSERLQWDWN